MLMNTSASLTVPKGGKAVRFSELTPLVFSVLFFVTLVIFPKASGEAVARTLTACAKRLIPSLFPFMAASELLLRLGFAEAMGNVIGKPFKKLFGISENGAAAFVIGALCGLPIGARYTLSLYKSDAISLSDCERLIAFSNNAGIGFTVIGVGYGIWGSYAFGWLLYLCQIFASVTVGATLFRDKKSRSIAPVSDDIPKYSLPQALCEAVSSAASGMISVCAFAVFFSTLAAMLESLSEALALPRLLSYAVSSALEISYGCELLHAYAVSIAPANGSSAVLLTFFAIGFTGMCVHAQTFFTSASSGVKLKKYMLIKLASGVVCALTGATVMHFFA